MAPRKNNAPAVQQPSPTAEIERPSVVEKVECPPELGPIAREEWDRVAPLLMAAGRLTPLDRSSLAVYCAAYATWLEASVALQTYGTVMKSPSGYPLQSPYVSIATKYADIMTRIASEFGFTPASRRRLPSAPDSSYLELLQLIGPIHGQR
jgi:P27 family predicted phage terminase small subunit